MSVVLGIGGWLLAVTGIGIAALIRLRLARQADAVARACHEVRGPLTAVRLGLELGGRLRQLSQSRLQAIELELSRAAVALDDLSAGRALRIAAEAVDIAELVTSSVEAWRPVAASNGTTIILHASPLPLRVAGERLRLAQAVGNLLANAIEHGGGAVQVRLRHEAARACIEVMDDGPGLPAPIDHLLRRGANRGRAGRGHGLGIVSAVAAAHGGRLAVAPSNRGARIVLELPAFRHLGDIEPQ